MRCRRWGSPFQRSAVFNRRTWPLVPLTICSLRIKWSKNHTSRQRQNPRHDRHPAPQQFRFNQLWKWYKVRNIANKARIPRSKNFNKEEIRTELKKILEIEKA